VFCFTLLDVGAKFAARHGIPTLEVVWARNATSLVLAVAILRPWRRFADYATRRPGAQALRALFLVVSTGLNFMALRHLQLAQTVSITFAAPFMVTAFAGPVLGEWAGPRRWAAIVVGFIGVLIIVQPEPGAFQPAALYSVGAAVCYAGYSLTTRMLSATESPASMLVYASLLGTLVLTPGLPAVAVMPADWLVAAALATTGLSAVAGHWLLILANRHAPATVLAPFTYTQLIWMVIAGYVVFDDVPNAATLIGALIVVASGLYVLSRERVHRDR
jgi:drug/metabolite transporter (DMT)-like permease